jgi:hypothetical protein
MVREKPVEVETVLSSVISVGVGQTASREVVYGSRVMVVVVDRVSGGKTKLQGGMQEIVGESSW